MKFFYVLFGFTVMTAGLYDFLFYRIHNIIVGTIFLLFIAMVLLCGVHHLSVTGLIAGAVFLVGFVFYLFKWMGAGDVKLLTATSLWAAHADTFGPFIFIMSLVGGLIGIIYLIIPIYIDWFRLRLISLLSVPLKKVSGFMRYAQEPYQEVYQVDKRKTPIPYGVAVVFASLYVVYFVLTGQVSYEG